jgi:hypothetical protein
MILGIYEGIKQQMIRLLRRLSRKIRISAVKKLV